MDTLYVNVNVQTPLYYLVSWLTHQCLSQESRSYVRFRSEETYDYVLCR